MSAGLYLLKSNYSHSRRNKTLSSQSNERADAQNRSEFSPDQLAKTIFDTLDQDKAEDIITIDLADKSSIADHMIVASGRSQRHVGALADRLLRTLKEQGCKGVRIEGKTNCDWVLIDAGDVVVHLFRPEVRGYYNLEKLWAANTQSDMTVNQA